MDGFKQFIEQEKSVKMFGLGKSFNQKTFTRAKAVNPARPFNGILVPDIISKPRKSNIIGQK